jgi:hypothetical protein
MEDIPAGGWCLNLEEGGVRGLNDPRRKRAGHLTSGDRDYEHEGVKN